MGEVSEGDAAEDCRASGLQACGRSEAQVPERENDPRP